MTTPGREVQAMLSLIVRLMPNKGQGVLCVVMTDGEENSSKETTGEQIKQIIAAREAQGDWTFVYIGASPDAWAHDMGLSAQNVAAYDANAPAASFRRLSESTTRYRRKAARASSDFLKKNGNGAH